MTLHRLNGRRSSAINLLPFDLALDANGRRLLRNHAFEDAVSRGQILAKQGEHGHELLLLTEGVIKLWKVLPDGRRLIVAFRAAGDLVSLHRYDTPWPTTAQATSNCRLIRIQWDDFRRLADRCPTLDRALFELASDEIANLQDRLLTLGRKTAEERLASFLLEFSLPSAAPSSFSREIHLPMRRPEIADYLGMTMESVSREFSRFKRLRIIAMPRPRCIVVLNKPVLEAMALGKSSLEMRSISASQMNGQSGQRKSLPPLRSALTRNRNHQRTRTS